MILWGSPGVGKTTIAKILASTTKYKFITVSAMFTGIAEFKSIFEHAKQCAKYNQKTLLFVDEIHSLNSKQQDIFLPLIEDGTIVLIGATAENPSFHLNKALLSRCQVVELKPLEHTHFLTLLQRVEEFYNEKFNFSDDIINYLINSSNGDGRYFISMLETLKTIKDKNNISLGEVKNFVRKKLAAYDKNKDEHYNLISALHKSIRGSDEQASLYWFARMIKGGEDIKYLTRRLIRIASEDIGLADPNAISIVIDAANGYERLGSPEGELLLAQAVVYLALSPKSNAIYTAFNKAMAFAEKTANVKPPKHILNAPTKMMKELDYGKGYIYDHDTKDNFSGQNYFPEQMPREVFFSPKNIGQEKEYIKRIEYFNKLRNNLKSK